MIKKIVFFFSTYNIVIGLIITILSIFTVDFIRSLSTDVILPLLKTDLETQTKTIGNRTIKIGLFISATIRYLITLIIILSIIHFYPLQIKDDMTQ